MPLCPTEEVGNKLKDQQIFFGPCVPISDQAPAEEREQALDASGYYTREDAAPGVIKDESVCATVESRTRDGEITAELPCGEKGGPVGVNVDSLESEAAEVDGQTCLKYSFTGEAVEGRESQIACPGE